MKAQQRKKQRLAKNLTLEEREELFAELDAAYPVVHRLDDDDEGKPSTRPPAPPSTPPDPAYAGHDQSRQDPITNPKPHATDPTPEDDHEFFDALEDGELLEADVFYDASSDHVDERRADVAHAQPDALAPEPAARGSAASPASEVIHDPTRPRHVPSHARVCGANHPRRTRPLASACGEGRAEDPEARPRGW